MTWCCLAQWDDEMASPRTLVCVKQVKEGIPESEWDESMPLPGDIIEGVATGEEEHDDGFVPAKVRSELRSQLAKMNRLAELIWVKVRRGDGTLTLRARVVLDQGSKLQRKFTIGAVSDARHVAVLGDLTLDQCAELQEMSRRVVNVVDNGGFKKKGMKYDWKKKVGTHLPHHQASVICSVLFMPLTTERSIEVTTGRSMAWLAAAISSGAPLIFVNIQTEQIVSSKERGGTFSGSSGQLSRWEMNWHKQHASNATIQIVQGIRLWFLPGEAEILIMLTPEPGETRFGMDIRRTEEGFICMYSVTKGLAADRAGLRRLREQAIASGRLVVISRLQGKSLLPSFVSSAGLIHCCEPNDVKEWLASAIERTDTISLCIMTWPTQKGFRPSVQSAGLAILKPAEDYGSTAATFGRTTSNVRLDYDNDGFCA